MVCQGERLLSVVFGGKCDLAESERVPTSG